MIWYDDDFSDFDLLCFGNVRASRIAHGGVKIKLPLSRVANESLVPVRVELGVYGGGHRRDGTRRARICLINSDNDSCNNNNNNKVCEPMFSKANACSRLTCIIRAHGDARPAYGLGFGSIVKKFVFYSRNGIRRIRSYAGSTRGGGGRAKSSNRYRRGYRPVADRFPNG